MKVIFSNLKLIFKNPKYIVAYFLLVFLLAWAWYNFTDFALMRGNYGMTHYWYDGVISWINILAFPLFIVAWIYRSYTFGSCQSKWEKNGFFGGILSILISGSICCGSSILTTFGVSVFAQFISDNPLLPFKGLELKTLGVIILLYALHSLLNNLLVCKTKIKKSSK